MANMCKFTCLIALEATGVMQSFDYLIMSSFLWCIFYIETTKNLNVNLAKRDYEIMQLWNFSIILLQ